MDHRGEHRMKILTVVVLAILLTGMVSAVRVLQTKTSGGQVWYVGDTPFQFPNITAAINFENVTDGDIIEVEKRIGNYEENVVVNKSLTIRHYSYEPDEYPTLFGGFNVTSPGVQIDGFIIQGNFSETGILLISSSNIVTNNTIRLNGCGVLISGTSANNTLQNNVMENNNRGFGIGEGTLEHFIQWIDSSNTVNGKPICYLVNKHDERVTMDLGYLAIVNSSGITADSFPQTRVEGVEIAYSSGINIRNLRHYDFVYLYRTDDSVIENNTSPDLGDILLRNSNRNLVQNNTIVDPESYGIDLGTSNDNIIANNVLKNMVFGIFLSESNGTSICGNNISQTDYGAHLHVSNGTRIFHNNFIGNTEHAGAWGSFDTLFDNGYEGNYWDNYKTKCPSSAEIDGTGIWNTSYPINSAYSGDNFPLVEKWTTCRTIDVTWYANVPAVNKTYFVTISCPNLVRASTKLTPIRTEGIGFFTFNVTAGSQGNFNVTIPRDRLDYPFELYINGSLIQSSDYQLNYTNNSASLYFQYPEGRHFVKIVGYKVGNICGDLNNDGTVNMRDIQICILNFNKHE